MRAQTSIRVAITSGTCRLKDQTSPQTGAFCWTLFRNVVWLVDFEWTKLRANVYLNNIYIQYSSNDIVSEVLPQIAGARSQLKLTGSDVINNEKNAPVDRLKSDEGFNKQRLTSHERIYNLLPVSPGLHFGG